MRNKRNIGSGEVGKRKRKKLSVHELCSITTKAKEYLHDNFMKKDT